MHNNETKDKFIELRLKGASLADIAKKIGVSKTTLVDWNQRYAEEVRALRSAELESLHHRILQSYESDFNRLSKAQLKLDKRFEAEEFKYWITGDKLVRIDQIIRQQIRQIRHDIESFGRISEDPKKPKTSAPKSETSNSTSAPLPLTPRFNEGPRQSDDATKTVSTVSAPDSEPSKNLTVS